MAYWSGLSGRAQGASGDTSAADDDAVEEVEIPEEEAGDGHPKMRQSVKRRSLMKNEPDRIVIPDIPPPGHGR
jgi:hypothetical protein